MSRRQDRKREQIAQSNARTKAELEITMLYHAYNGVTSTTVDHAAIGRMLAELTGLDSAQVAAEAAKRLAAYWGAEQLRAGFAARKAAEVAQYGRELKRPADCTKHVYSGRRLVNLYGGIHRTPGPACDGTEHRRTAWWW